MISKRNVKIWPLLSIVSTLSVAGVACGSVRALQSTTVCSCADSPTRSVMGSFGSGSLAISRDERDVSAKAISTIAQSFLPAFDTIPPNQILNVGSGRPKYMTRRVMLCSLILGRSGQSCLTVNASAATNATLDTNKSQDLDPKNSSKVGADQIIRSHLALLMAIGAWIAFYVKHYRDDHIAERARKREKRLARKYERAATRAAKQ